MTPGVKQKQYLYHENNCFKLQSSARPELATSTDMERARLHGGQKSHERPFRSRLIEDVVEKPWLEQEVTRAEAIAEWIPRAGLIFGACILAAYMYGGWTAWETNKYCLIMEDNFETLNTSIWAREVELGGFGNGEFEWTTPYEENCYVKDGRLYLVPTMGQWPETEGAILNLTSMGICTADPERSGRKLKDSCFAIRNSTSGTYLPPIESARINTRDSFSIRYGRVEITAKLPVGDWIWPAMWMLPANNTYGLWPQSGEIDIAESRGNGPSFLSVDAKGYTAKGGHNTVVSTLHWGTNTPYTLDQSGLTTNGLTFPSGYTSLTRDFHVFGLEWTSRSIRTYVDKRLTRVAKFGMPKQGFWSFGAFSKISSGAGYTFSNPWVGSTTNAPFDQEFYLVMNLAVGGLGYFNTVDGIMPWDVGDGRDAAMKEFMEAKDSWYPTWGTDDERGLVVKNVKMWKLCP